MNGRPEDINSSDSDDVDEFAREEPAQDKCIKVTEYRPGVKYALPTELTKAPRNIKDLITSVPQQHQATEENELDDEEITNGQTEHWE